MAVRHLHIVEQAPEPFADDELLTREQLRSRRKREVRSRTIAINRLSQRELNAGREENPEELTWRPLTRGDCYEMSRPCPFVSCKHHLYLDVSGATGSIKLNFPDLEPDEMGESCALDVADRGGATLEDVGAIMNFTRERTRQLEVIALGKLESRRGMMLLKECTTSLTFSDARDGHGARRLVRPESEKTGAI